MELDGTLGLLALLLHWRVALCLLFSTVAAVLAVHLFPWLTGLQGIVLAFLGLGVGVMWEAQSGSKVSVASVPDTKTTQSVAGAAAGIVGATWGGFSSTSVQSFMAGLVIFVAAAACWAWYAGSAHAWVSRRRAQFCVFVAAVAYPLGALLGRHAL